MSQSSSRLISAASLASLLGTAASVSVGVDTGLITTAVMSSGPPLVSATSRMYISGVPVELISAALAATISAAYFASRFKHGAPVGLIDPWATAMSVPILGGILGMVALQSPVPWLLAPSAVPAAVLVVIASGPSANWQRQKRSLLDYPLTVSLVVAMAVAAALGCWNVAVATRAVGDSFVVRQIDDWWAALPVDRTLSQESQSAVVVTAVVDHSSWRPEVEAYRAVVAKHTALSGAVRWEPVYLPTPGVCGAGDAADCTQYLAGVFLQERLRPDLAVELGRETISDDMTEEESALAYLAALDLRDEFEADRSKLIATARRSAMLFQLMESKDVPAVYVNGRRLSWPTPDVVDAAISRLREERR